MGKYKRFNETRREIIVLDEWVEMTWHGKTIPYYRNLGYDYTGLHDKFLCRVCDLSHNSEIFVSVKCPVCEQTRRVKYCHTVHYGHTLCKGCAKTLDLRGERFGRWLVLNIDINGSYNGNTKWICECSCGNIRSVFASGLTACQSTSCGCYHREMASNMSGENSPHWKGGGSELVCGWCGESYFVDHYTAKVSKFCSRECAGKWRSENIIGENHWAWDNSISQEERIIGRNYSEYTQYTKSVMNRDNSQCQLCGNAENPEVHHLFSYAYYPEYALSIEHGVVLCQNHHAEFHRWMGGTDKSCVPADFDRWLYATS